MSEADCPITEYVICEDAACATQINDLARFKITGSTLDFYRSQPVAPYSVYIGVKTKGYKTFTEKMSIQICGYETVTVKNATTLALVINSDEVQE